MEKKKKSNPELHRNDSLKAIIFTALITEVLLEK